MAPMKAMQVRLFGVHVYSSRRFFVERKTKKLIKSSMCGMMEMKQTRIDTHT